MMLDTLVPVLGIAGAITLGAISPGPSFVMVARTAVARSRMDALAAALGMGLGGVIFTGAALLGLHVALSAVPWLYLVLKLLGGAYLVVIGVSIWRAARVPLRLADPAPGGGAGTRLQSLGLGLLTQVSNPKTAVVYASIFASLLPREVPAGILLGLPLVIFVIEAGWYSIVALALSTASPRAAYLRFKAWIDRATGSVMALLGVKLITGAGQV